MTENTNTPTTSTVRAWASAQGYNVGSRGRISAEIRDAYQAAHAPVVQG